MKIARRDRRSLSSVRHRLDLEPDRPREFNRFFAIARVGLMNQSDDASQSCIPENYIGISIV